MQVVSSPTIRSPRVRQTVGACGGSSVHCSPIRASSSPRGSRDASPRASPRTAYTPGRAGSSTDLSILGALMRARHGSLQEAFNLMDIQKRGFVSREQFMSVTQSLGYGESASEIFRVLDKSGSGSLSATDFLEAFERRAASATPSRFGMESSAQATCSGSPQKSPARSTSRPSFTRGPSIDEMPGQRSRSQTVLGAGQDSAAPKGVSASEHASDAKKRSEPTEWQPLAAQLTHTVTKLTERMVTLEKAQKRSVEQSTQMVRELVATTFAEQATNFQQCRSEVAELRKQLDETRERQSDQEARTAAFQEKFETYSHLVEDYLGDIKGMVFETNSPKDKLAESVGSVKLRESIESLQKALAEANQNLELQGVKLSTIEQRMCDQSSLVSPAFSFKDDSLLGGAASEGKKTPGCSVNAKAPVPVDSGKYLLVGNAPRQEDQEASANWRQCELKLQAAALDEVRAEISAERSERAAQLLEMRELVQAASCHNEAVDLQNVTQTAEERLQVRLDLALAGARDDIIALGRGLDECRNDVGVRCSELGAGIEKERSDREEKLQKVVQYFETSLRQVAKATAQVEEMVEERVRASDLRMSSMQCEIQGQSCCVEELRQGVTDMKEGQNKWAQELQGQLIAIVGSIKEQELVATGSTVYGAATKAMDSSIGGSVSSGKTVWQPMEIARELTRNKEVPALPAGVSSCRSATRASPEVEMLLNSARERAQPHRATMRPVSSGVSASLLTPPPGAAQPRQVMPGGVSTSCAAMPWTAPYQLEGPVIPQQLHQVEVQVQTVQSPVQHPVGTAARRGTSCDVYPFRSQVMHYASVA